MSTPTFPACLCFLKAFRLSLFSAFLHWFCLGAFLMGAGALPGQEGRYELADTALAQHLKDESRLLIESGEYDVALEKLDTMEQFYKQMAEMESKEYSLVLNWKGVCYYFKGNYNQAVEFHQKALDIELKILGPEHVNVAKTYNHLGRVYTLIGDYEQATEFIQKALKIWSKTLGSEHHNVALAYNILGVITRLQGDYDRAEGFHKKALTICLETLGPEHPYLASFYNNLGLVYESKGDYRQAIEFHQNALEIQLKIFTPDHPDVASSYSNLGIVYDSKGDYIRAAEFSQKALDLRMRTLNPEHPDVAYSYNILGVIHINKGDYEQAIEFFYKALEIWLKTFNQEHPLVAVPYSNLGMAYDLKGNYERAVEMHQKSLEIRLKMLGPEHPEVAISYNNLGHIYDSGGNFKEAVELYQKALEIRLKTLSPENPFIASTLINLLKNYQKQGKFAEGEPLIAQALQALNYDNASSLNQTNSFPQLIATLAAKGTYYQAWYTHSQNPHHLHTARRSFAEALTAITYQRRQLENPGSRSTLAQKSTSVYEGGISSNLSLHHLTDSLHYLYDAFYYAEQYKALSLYEAVKNAEALHVAGIPDSLLQQEYDQRVDIAFYEKKRQELFAEGKQETDSTVLAVSGQLFELNRAHEALVRRFETEYPDYFRLKFDFSTAGIEEVQQQLLQPNQTLLEYFTGDSSIFIFAVRQDTALAFEIKKDFPLEAWVDSLRLSMAVNYTTGAADYCRLAWRLYEKLVLPVEGILSDELIIIPDGKLNYLPFEALLSAPAGNPVHFRDHPYLLRRCRISYCYSATLLREMRNKWLLNKSIFPEKGDNRFSLSHIYS